jgi:methylenetetrahydrofolate reductase (NADPH)
MNITRGAMARLVREAYLEVIPTPSVEQRMAHLPAQAYVSITCSPVNGIEPTLELVEKLSAQPQEKQLKLIPHVAARVVRDKAHLGEILARLQAVRVESVFVPGGDAAEPAGEYDCSLDLLRDMAEIGHDIAHVGVASHPEGHPLVDDAELLRLLLEKQAYANYLVTQMCFDPGVLIRWLRRIRAAGVTMPAWIGLPGVAEAHRLISLSMKIGVGQSIRVLKRQKGLLRKMVAARPYQPDELLAGLQPQLDDPSLNIEGFHLFSFNNIERTERWRVETLSRLNGAEE